MTDNGSQPKVLGEIRARLIEQAGGNGLQFEVQGVLQDNELLMRGIWDKARDLLTQLFIQKMLSQMQGAPRIAPASALDQLKRHERG